MIHIFWHSNILWESEGSSYVFKICEAWERSEASIEDTCQFEEDKDGNLRWEIDDNNECEE